MIRLIYNLLWPVGLLLFLPGYLAKMFRRGGYRRNFGQRLGFYSAESRERLRGMKTSLLAVSILIGGSVTLVLVGREPLGIGRGRNLGGALAAFFASALSVPATIAAAFAFYGIWPQFRYWVFDNNIVPGVRNHPACSWLAKGKLRKMTRKRGHDRSRNDQRAGEERCQRAAEIPLPTDTQSLAANEN